MKPHGRMVGVTFALLSAGPFLPSDSCQLAAQSGSVRVRVSIADDSLRGIPVLVTLLAGGGVISQSEVLHGKTANLKGPVGLVDLRTEGAGMLTEVKQGVHAVNPTQQAPGTFEFVMHAGVGARIVEYAEGGLAREEVAHRLRELEAHVAVLRGVVDSVREELASTRGELAVIRGGQSPP